MNGFPLFRLFDPEDALPVFGLVSPATRERFVLVGTVLLVAIAITGLVVRHQLKRRHSRRQRHSRRRGPFHPAVAGVAEFKRLISEKPRRRRREHHPRNPTLAETGGLPPLRSDGPPERFRPSSQPR